MAQINVSLRELKANLSAVVRRVRSGDTATICSHRTPVARLVPLGGAESAAPDSVAGRLMAAGVTLHASQASLLQRHPPNPLPPGVASLSDAVIEDRGPS